MLPTASNSFTYSAMLRQKQGNTATTDEAPTPEPPIAIITE